MTSFVTAFGAILSELPTNLKAKIPLSVLLPLAITIAALLSIFARVHGLDALQELWTDATAVEQTLLSALALVIFYVVAYVLSALQPVVEQAFQQAFGILGVKQVLAGTHRDEWERRSIEERLWRNLYNDLKQESTAVNDLLNRTTEAPGAKTDVPETTGMVVPSALPPIDHPLPPADEEESAGSGETDATKALRERLLRNPWFRGMHQVTVTCVEADLPDELNIEAIVRLIDRSAPSSQLVPGGALVIEKSPLPAAANRLPGMDLVQVSIAVPPDHVNGINVALAAGSVGIFVRPTPEPTLIWDDTVNHTRRWIPTPDLPPQFAPVSPGDMLDITVTHGNGTPIMLTRVVFAEVTDSGWAIAVPLDQAELVAGVTAARVTGRTNAKVQKFNTGQKPWTYWQAEPTGVLESIGGEVHSGKFRDREGNQHPDVVIHATELVGRYAVETIEADTPIERRKLGPLAADRDKVTIAPRPEPIARPGDGDWAHYFKERADGEKVDVAFNLRFLSNNMIIVPKNFTFDGFKFLCSSGFREKFSPGNAWFRTRLDTSPRLPETPFVLSRGPLTKADFRIDRLAMVSRPWRAMHGVQLKQGDFAFDKNSKAILGDVNVIKVINPFPDALVVTPYRSPSSDQDTALAIAQRLQMCQFSRKRLLTAHPILAGNEILMKAMLRQFRDDAKLMLTDCQTWVDLSRINMRLFYPREKSRVQPTAVGNILASVESYGYHAYGLDTPLVFARLRNLLSTDELTSVNDAHEQFRFIQWCMLASIIIGTIGSAIAAHGHARWLMGTLWGLMLIIAPFLLRRAMVSAALAYAEQLRSILDRYRGRVFGSMGISPDMDDKGQTTTADERQRWKDLGWWWEYGGAELPGKYTLDRELGTAATAKPGEAKVES